MIPPVELTTLLLEMSNTGSGGLKSFIEVPIRPNPITLAHCKMLPAIPLQDIGSKGFSPNRSVVNLILRAKDV